MKYALFVSLLICASTSFAGGSAPGETPVVPSGLAFGFYREVAKKPGNVFVSPYSLASALTMASAGARGATLAELRSTLGLTDSPHEAESDLRAALVGEGEGRPVLEVANHLWARTGQEYEPDFLILTQKYYGAGFSAIDFARNPERARAEINDWAAAETHHKIQNLIPPGAFGPKTELVLTNAVYFRGRWRDPFNKIDTFDQPFHPEKDAAVDRAFMHRLSRVDYWANASFQAVRLPYEGGDFAMTIVLPRDGTKLAQLTPELLGHIRGHLRLQRVRLSIPKFHIEYGTEASGALERLGLKTAFTRAADFSGIRRPTRDDPLYLTKAFQRTYLDVYEKGTEAAAATALIAEMGASRLAMESIPPFDANHPFFFSIENVRTGTVLFEGRLAKP